ncbi:MAG: hypothetical protein JWM90_1284 [Thermoleophilia bacterium]|nr:hypothetical protein [Thermoleophilia bacterium]
MAGFNDMLGKVPGWAGPVMAIGGAALATFALIKGKPGSFIKMAGVASGVGLGLGGLAATHAVAGAKGAIQGKATAEAEILPAFQQYQAEAENTIIEQQSQYQATIDALKAKLDAGGTGTTPGTTTPGTTTPGTTTPGTTTPGTTLPDGTAPIIDLPTTPGTTGTGPAGALVGTTISLPAGGGAAGEIASAGAFTIAGLVGDANGYGSLAEANAAARATIDTEAMGSKFLRWVVVENGGRFYGAVAQAAPAGTTGGNLTAQQGTLAAWNALSHLDSGWQSYGWTKDGGAQSVSIPYGVAKPFANGQSAPGTTTPGTTTPTTTAPTTTTPTTTGSTFNVASAVGRTFAINDSATAEGATVRGGTLQLQQVVGSATGYASGEEAAAAARQARATSGGGTEWSRWITTQGGDGRYYAFQGSVVSAKTEELETASPLHVFGNGFAEYYDGASAAWQAVRDA